MESSIDAFFRKVLDDRTSVASQLEEIHGLAWEVMDSALLDLCRLRVAMLLHCDSESKILNSDLDSEKIASLYNVSQNQVSIIPYDVAYAIKITVPRLVFSGSFGDTDIYGAQQHGPLLDIEVPD